jgi:tetratricopeptide (TPR) repeat protein
MVYYAQGKIEEAAQCFAKALQLAANNADVNYNAALVALAQNDLAKAEAHLAKAKGTEGNLNVAWGTFYVMKGDYAAAKTALGNATGNNAAVLHILLQDYAAARKALADVETPNATTAYLFAIIGARTNNPNEVYTNLEAAVKCANLKARAQNDIEFAKYQNDEKFQAIVK